MERIYIKGFAHKSVPPIRRTLFPDIDTSKPKNFLNMCKMFHIKIKKKKSDYIVKQSVMGFSYLWPKNFTEKCNK